MSRRLLAELCLVLVVGGLVAGVVIGSGLSVTKVDVPNVLTWLSTRHGDVVQVNPYRGTQDRLKIGQPGDTLQVVQNGKQLIVYDTTTGKMTFIDLTTLTMSGQRQGPAGEGGLKVLLGDAIFVADPKSGTVVALDPLTASTVAAWQSPGALADVAISGAGDRLFAIDAHGTETTLGYSGTAFAVQGKREIAGAGGHAVLVGNPSGFTVLDGGSHLVGQFDTGSQDRTGVVPAVDDPVLAPVTSSSTLVGATSTTSDSLVLVREDRDVTVSLAGSGCMPERPAVYQSKVYLHCRGANKVLVFDRDGRQVGPIPSPTGASEMVDNGDMLFINFPGDDSAVVVDQNGAVRQLSTDAPSVPARDLNAAPTTVPSQGDRGANRGPQPPQATHRQPTNPSNGGQGTNAPRHSPRTNASANGTPSADPSGTADPTTTPSPVSSPVPSGGTLSDGPTAEPPSPTQPSPTKASPPPDPATYTPTGVVAQAIDNSWIQLTWTPPPAGAPQLYRYLDAATGAELGSTAAPGGQNSATITTVPPGTTLSIVVEATYPVGVFRSAPSNAITTFGPPGLPSNVSAHISARSPTSMSLSINFDPPTSAPAPTDYALTVSGDFQNSPINASQPIGNRPQQVDIACGSSTLCLHGGSLSVSLTLSASGHPGPTLQVQVQIPEPAVNVPGSVYIVGPNNLCLDIDRGIVANSIRTVLNPCNNAASEHWYVTGSGGPLQGPTDVLGSTKCVDVNDGSSGAGADIQIFSCNGGNNQKWIWYANNGNQRSLQRSGSGNCIYLVSGGAVGSLMELEPCPATTWSFFNPDSALDAQPTVLVAVAISPGAVHTLLAAHTDEIGAPGTTAVLFFPFVFVATRALVRRRRRG